MMDSKSVDLNISNISADKSVCIEMLESEDPAVTTVENEDHDVSRNTTKGLDLVFSPKFVPTGPEHSCCYHVNTLIWNVFMLFKDFCSFCGRKKGRK